MSERVPDPRDESGWLHARCTEALLRHRGCDVPKDRDWASVQFGEIAAGDVRAILAALPTPNEEVE